MKKRILALLTGTLLGAFLLPIKTNTAPYLNSGVVTETGLETVTFSDRNGNLWRYYGSGPQEGDTVVVIMDNSETEMVYDDVVTSVLYIGR